jgi:hypothetical protein
MKSGPEIIELDEEDLRAKLHQIEAALGSEMASPFRSLLDAYVTLLAMLRDKNISIARLQKLIFGAQTERSSNILPKEEEEEEQEDDSSALADTVTVESDAAAGNGQVEQEEDSTSQAGDSPSSSGDGKPRKGHGRIPASAYSGCSRVLITHDSLSPGDACLNCQGTVYRQSEWSLIVRLKGQPPVGGTVYQLERLRCHLCGDVYTADLPEEASSEKYDPTVPSIIATLRYGEGLPWNRIQRIQAAAGIPLPASTQWQLVRDAIPGGIQAAHDHLLELGAQGELFHNDDTAMRVLALTEKKKLQQPLLEEDPQRSGVFTTGILSRAQGRPTIALFFTGPHHAGENLRNVLAKRGEELPLPIQMCDGLSRNVPKDLRVILANCLTHSRRNFVEVIDAFPSEVKYVIQCLKKVYKADAEAREQKLSPADRLRLHQERSQPVMDELHKWLQEQFDEKKVEPNSSLGGAISYMLKRWDELTLFLRVPGAPLDNNLCEQALKMAIRHRKNSLFYKTMRGAEVGDLYMSLIHTCYFSDADPFHYLTELQRHADRVVAAPGDWMPWNYRQQLFTDGDSESSRSPPGATDVNTEHPR